MEYIMMPCISCGKETDNPENLCMACQEDLNIWSIHRYRVYCEQLRNDIKKDGCYTDEIVLGIAMNIIDFNRELKEFMERELGVDPRYAIERLANDI